MSGFPFIPATEQLKNLRARWYGDNCSTFSYANFFSSFYQLPSGMVMGWVGMFFFWVPLAFYQTFFEFFRVFKIFKISNLFRSWGKFVSWKPGPPWE